MYVTWSVAHHDRATLIWGGGWFVFTVPLDNQFFLLYRLFLDTLLSLHIVMMLVVTHFYMMISLTVSLTAFLFLVALRSLTTQQHSLCIHIRLQREKPHLQREGVNIQRESHMIYRFQIHREIRQVCFIFC